MKSSLLFLLLMEFALSPCFARGRQPEEKKKTPQERSLKDDANQALDDLSTGIHKAGAAAKEGANEALNAVDRGVHKITGSDKK